MSCPIGGSMSLVCLSLLPFSVLQRLKVWEKETDRLWGKKGKMKGIGLLKGLLSEGKPRAVLGKHCCVVHCSAPLSCFVFTSSDLPMLICRSQSDMISIQSSIWWSCPDFTCFLFFSLLMWLDKSSGISCCRLPPTAVQLSDVNAFLLLARVSLRLPSLEIETRREQLHKPANA